jgi:hypothetical protein
MRSIELWGALAPLNLEIPGLVLTHHPGMTASKYFLHTRIYFFGWRQAAGTAKP